MPAQIYIAEEAGACYGVNRALEMVKDAAAHAEGPIHTLGPLIHNPTVVSELEAAGVGVVERASDCPGGTLLLRTHGVTPSEEAEARAAHDTVLDATCPFVVRAHAAAEELTAEGYRVIVLGEGGHPEVEGTVGHAPGALVVESVADLEQLDHARKVGVVVQTTQSRAHLREIVSALIGKADEVRVIDTICEATTLRQAAAEKLSREVDVMIVIGGRISANTTRLAEICSTHCAKNHHIESASEIDRSWFAGASKVGITAGASTPQAQIDEVRSVVEELVS